MHRCRYFVDRWWQGSLMSGPLMCQSTQCLCAIFSSCNWAAAVDEIWCNLEFLRCVGCIWVNDNMRWSRIKAWEHHRGMVAVYVIVVKKKKIQKLRTDNLALIYRNSVVFCKPLMRHWWIAIKFLMIIFDIVLQIFCLIAYSFLLLAQPLLSFFLTSFFFYLFSFSILFRGIVIWEGQIYA